jgi:hypothetical protein
MPAKKESPMLRAQKSYRELISVAHTLNEASDQLGKIIGPVDEALKALNLGISSWVSFNHFLDNNMNFDCDQVGYSKVGGKWGIAIRSLSGNEDWPENTTVDGPWLFNEAPRRLRIGAIDKIPELLEALVKDATDTTNRINQKLRETEELAKVISVHAGPKEESQQESPLD